MEQCIINPLYERTCISDGSEKKTSTQIFITIRRVRKKTYNLMKYVLI